MAQTKPAPSSTPISAKPFSPKTAALTVVKGFCMGAADIVPGVSGGTVALVFGIYEQLLKNVRQGAKVIGSVLKFDFGGAVKGLKAIEWGFLLPLVVGIGAALVSLASIIENQLDKNPEAIAGLFFGLVAGSIIVAWGLLHTKTSRDGLIVAAVGVISFYLLGFQSGPVADPPLWAYPVAGAIAICAMILPGISGSFLLLMMGMYAAVLGAAHDLGSQDLINLGLFALGATAGLALFSTGLGWLLERYHDMFLAALIGLMVGSFRVLWPWPNGVGIISEVEGETKSGTGLELPPESGDYVVPILLAIGAFLIVVGVGHFQKTVTPAADS